MKRAKTLWMVALAVLLLVAGLYAGERRGVPAPAPAPARTAVEEIVLVANEVVEAFVRRDGERLAGRAHPHKGVRFSPYAYVDVEEDRVFLPAQLRHFWDDATVHVWGHADGSGEPIALTAAQYVERFVLDRDYRGAGSIGVNVDQQRGNTADNAAQAYPQGTRVEYYVEPAPGGGAAAFDWSALRLVFEQVDGRWLLVGVIHDQWTT
ncbi:hypothetical protein [Thauera aminoaromatica]|uniref:Uncharacterized protein n=1 Tax=Thauera aminoaromatica S2 TaxID=1234381 RepID=N6XZS5_THASP|nr:hypothetical protein [Thauera aminoaromatica]ENO84770.1 hypothetical protein C665_12256 [Thauera aminoaromatica S2]